MNISFQTDWFDDRTAKWNNKKTPEFAEIVTKFGFSHAFNMIESSLLLKTNLSDEFYYKYNKTANYPWKTGVGKKKGLSLKFFAQMFFSECTKSSFAIHSPFEFPNDNDFISLDDNFEYIVSITPTITKADDNLKALPIDARKCYFDGERELKFFKIYTHKNCEFECLSEKLYKKCDCVPFHYIRKPSWEVCEQRRMKNCIQKYIFERSMGQKDESDNCNCLPTCSSVTYVYEVIESKLVKKEVHISIVPNVNPEKK